MAVILVGGGARSGKSRYALDRARRAPLADACPFRARGSETPILSRDREGAVAPHHNLIFIATAEPRDDEMRARIEKHRADRGPDFTTVEAPVELAAAIRNARADAIVVDCLTLWLANILDRNIDAAIDDLEQAARSSQACLIFVTNEVGAGIVPENALAREFRDRAGILNQRMADAASEVYWMIFGQPLRVK